MHLDNTFGVEIECYLPEGGTTTTAAAAVSQRTDSLCVAQAYNHTTLPHWKIVTDGSLGDYQRGIEAVSPILTGEAGLVTVEKVMRALTDYGCTVSRRCGFHVHVGAGTNPPVQFFRNIFKLYALYEPVIDRFMPASRRLSANSYCRSITNVALSSVDTAADLDSIIRLMTSHGGEARFHKLNLSAYRRHRTVEFRQHSGTLEGNKARNWATLCLRMAERAKSELVIGSNTTSTTGDQRNRARYGSKAWEIGQMLLRPEGVTPQEVRNATGWPSVSMPAQLAMCGLGYTTQRMGRQIRYFAQATTMSTNITIDTSLDGLFNMIGCDESERAYFRERTANLNGLVDWAA